MGILNEKDKDCKNCSSFLFRKKNLNFCFFSFCVSYFLHVISKFPKGINEDVQLNCFGFELVVMSLEKEKKMHLFTPDNGEREYN